MVIKNLGKLERRRCAQVKPREFQRHGAWRKKERLINKLEKTS